MAATQGSMLSCKEAQGLIGWVTFVRDGSYSRAEKWRLLDHYEGPEEIYSRSTSEIESLLGRVYSQKRKPTLLQVEDDMKWLNHPGRFLLTCRHKSFPENLRNIDDKPLALFLCGNLRLLETPMISIVGSRKPTSTGVEATRRVATEISRCGVTIVSGLAYGVDSIAHGAILPQKGKCIAIMGCGLDIIYPKNHRWLFEKILLEDGLLISEYPLGTQPTRYTFPERNRLVSGLSDGVLVIEAAKKSGTLITANFACDQGKPLMVMPGSAFSKQYEGSHKLIQDGAHLVTSAKEVLHVLSSQWSIDMSVELYSNPVAVNEFDSLQAQTLELLKQSPKSLDALKENSSLTTAELSAMLLEMELLGHVARDQHGNFIATM